MSVVRPYLLAIALAWTAWLVCSPVARSLASSGGAPPSQSVVARQPLVDQDGPFAPYAASLMADDEGDDSGGLERHPGVDALTTCFVGRAFEAGAPWPWGATSANAPPRPPTPHHFRC